jgi:two-component system, NtrC family, response regulator GlrR
VIDVATVSRRHVELTLVPEGVLVRDISRNGTTYNGQKIERMVIGASGALSIGPSIVRIEIDGNAIREALAPDLEAYRDIVGRSPSMRALFAQLQRLEGSLVTVLIEGESGTGKERVAQALHEGSMVAPGPLVVLNCGALPRELIGSELFGHKRGAFSGALDARKGAFRSADGGTLFLDEIGELPLDQQPALLRALETGEFRPIGEDQPTRVRLRIIAATNRDLGQEVADGRFRRDLYYRLAVVRLRVPPLDERVEDIEPLARHFASSLGLNELQPEIFESLKRRRWPGNVRELQNAIAAFAALGTLPPPESPQEALAIAGQDVIDFNSPYADQKEAIVNAFTARYLKALMDRTNGNQSEASRISGIHRNHLARLLAKMSGLDH